MEPGISHSPNSLQIPPADESRELLDLSPEERLFHEINLLRIEGYCFSFDPKSAAKRAGKQEFIELVKMPEGAVSRPITIEPHPTYGYPATLAYKILQAVLKKLSDEGYEGADSASFTQRELAKLVGRQTFGGADSKQFLRGVMQLNATRIWCSFFDKETGDWKVLTFTLFTEGLFSGRKHQLRECVLTLHPRIVASLRNRHYFCLNYNRLTRLEPIGMALFKHLFFQMSRTYSKLKEPNFSYERNYDAICTSWLGGLKVLQFRAHILKDQLGRHLQDLKRVKLIRSFDIVRNDEGGFKVVVKPGAGFFEDYERYYGTHRQLPFPFKRATEENSIKRPLALLSYFHKRRLGVDELAEQVFPEKEAAFARALTEKYPDNVCQEVVDYGLEQAKAKGYDVQTLSGIGVYVNDFFATKAERERRAAEMEALEAKKRQEAEAERQRERYDLFFKLEIKRIRESLTPEALTELEAPIVAEQRTKYPGLNAGMGMLVYFRSSEVLAARHKIPSFEEWLKNPRLE